MSYRHPLSVLTLFRSGLDTTDIANHLHITEAEALEQLSRERSALLGRGSPYVQPEKPVSAPLHRYAGHSSSRISGV